MFLYNSKYINIQTKSSLLKTFKLSGFTWIYNENFWLFIQTCHQYTKFQYIIYMWKVIFPRLYYQIMWKKTKVSKIE